VAAREELGLLGRDPSCVSWNLLEGRKLRSLGFEWSTLHVQRDTYYAGLEAWEGSRYWRQKAEKGRCGLGILRHKAGLDQVVGRAG
jgi:hypothetical protein